MKSVMKTSAFALLILAVVALSFGLGVGVGQSVGAQPSKVFAVQGGLSNNDSEAPPTQFTLLDEIWQVLVNDFVDSDALDREQIGTGAIQGVITALDDAHTSYIDAETYKNERVGITGSYEGIGAHVATVEGNLTIVAPIAGSPAEAAGIKSGDVVVSVNGESLKGLTLSQAVSKIKGPKGTKVVLEVIHPGESKAVVIEILRDEIKTPSVLVEILPEKIAHLRITHFSQRTNSELKEALKELSSEEVVGIVLDLRNNPGGLLDSTVEVTSQFLKGGVVAYQVDREGNRETLKVRRGGLATELPIAVLVNGGSASGSEILAGAIQDRDRGPLIGTKTFGKGSVNNLRELSDGSALYVTIARWLTPNDRLIEGNGLVPDIEVELTREDLVAGQDHQLQRALEYLKSGG